MNPPEQPPKPPTLRDIAKAAGVALSTVSDALNGKPGVAKKTRQQVLETATALGWKPNPLVSAWMSHIRTHSYLPTTQGLAYVVADKNGLEHHFATPTYAAYWQGVNHRATQLGYHPEIFSYYDVGGKRLSDLLYHRGIGPMVFAPLGTPEALEMKWEHFSSVSIAYSLLSPALHHVSSHHFQVVQLAIESLLQKGYKRIGFALPRDIDLRTAGMMSGSFLHARELRYPELLTRPFLNPFASFHHDTFSKWFKKEKPDAVIGIIWGERWLKDSDIPWINLDLKPEDAGFAGVQQNPKRIGAAAVDLVTAHWLRQETGIPTHPKTSLVHGDWVEGKLCR